MNNLKKFFNKRKKSIFSLMLALVLTLSFNYSPLALLVDTFKTNAYKSSSVQTYYPNSSTTSETNISAGNYPSSLKSYFEGSSNNFNIEKYYNTRFSDLFAKYADEYLKSIDETVKLKDTSTNVETDVAYKTVYTEFLAATDGKYDTLLEYYTAEATNIKNNEKCETFREYLEYFVSHEITYRKQTIGVNEGTQMTFSPIENFVFTENSNEYKIQFYNAFANYLDPNVGNPKVEDVLGEDGEPTGTTIRDGISDQTKFYEQSYSYNAVKKYIDDEISATVAIYTYDGETQNKNVAGILANEAPGSMSYYYKDNTFESTNKTTEKYVIATGNTKPNIYFLQARDATGSQNFIDNARGKGIDVDKRVVFDNDGSIKQNLEKYPLLYRLITPADGDDYMEQYITYYKYEAIPYQTLADGNYQVFVLDTNGITADEQATYDFMYLDVITDKNDIDSTYVNLPVPNGTSTETSYTLGLHDQYFIKVLGISPTSENESTTTDTGNITRFKNIIKQFTDASGNSTLYLKYKEAENKHVYIQTEDKSSFETKYPTYQYKDYVKTADFANMSEDELEEYYLVESSSYANYYKADYKLYFKKIRANYETLTNVTYKAGEYETKTLPNIPFEETQVASTKYEMDGNNKKIYVYIPTGKDSVDGIANLSQSTLEAAKYNEYVQVPESTVKKLDLDTSYTYYYHHELTEKIKKIYIVVDAAKYEDEKDNEVYKNLNYTVIPSKQIDGVANFYNYKDYITVEKSDANYNENFKLYYKYDSSAENIYVKNTITDKNALFVIDDSVTSSDKSTYKDGGRNFIVITTKEYEANHKFFTQLTSDDEFYNLKYTLYYKYNATNETERVIYENTTSKDSAYETFTDTSDDYLASDYELITPKIKNSEELNPDYVEGKNLYYKKIRDVESAAWYTQTPNITTYSYSTNSTITLSSNSYYVISFYVYTNGTYNHKLESVADFNKPVEASIYVEDTKGYITTANIEHISTNGKWEKHYLYIATNSLSASSVKLTMFMGDKTSIFGSQKETFFVGNAEATYTIGTAPNTKTVLKDTYSTANGTVLFDDIRVTKINLTDFNKLTIDGETVKTTAPEETEPGEPVSQSEPEYVDKYGNKIVVTAVNTNVNDSISAWTPDANPKHFEDNFNLDNLESYFSSLDFSNASNIDGYSELEALWQMYISRDVSGQGNNYILEQYQKAYESGKLSASIIDESTIYEDKLPEEDEDDDDDAIDSDAPSTEKEDVAFVESTFKDNNKILKLTNSSRQLTLGLISNYFTVKQNEYYKLTVWVLATKEDVKANLTLSSVLKTATTLTHGTLITSSASVNAYIGDYSTTQANEYGWIPVSFYIEGNALHSQKCYLTLSADKDTTIYYDNITIEKITSGAYDTANSDSDKTTFCLSLTPSKSIISAGVTNGYFNNVTVTDNYNSNIDYTAPRKAENWTIAETSTGVIAGVVPTSDEYLAIEDNFFAKYNSADATTLVEVPENSLKNNIYAIYAPATIENPLNSATWKDSVTSYAHKSTYSTYSSSISLSASTTYKLSFEFHKGLNFNGDIFAEVYTSSVKAENLISRMDIDFNDIANGWNKYTFYIASDASTASVYIKFGIKSATGTCFFRNVACVTTTETLDQIRDDMLPDSDNKDTTESDIFEKDCFKNVKFIDLKAFEFSIHGNDKDETNTYDAKEFTSNIKNTSTFTTGDTGVAVASYYTSTITKSYTVTINKVEYYIKGVEVEGSDDLVYKMYSDSNYTEEVTKLDGKAVVVDGTAKVTVGTETPTDYTITEKETTNYTYNFKNDVTINNVFIDAAELKNDYSENVLILANSFETDYTLATPVYSTTLSKTSYYVLKVYVKTSSFAENDFGLNIDLDSSISRKWTNIDTTDSKYDELRDENGFVCYQILISTNSSAISSFSVKFSLGTEKSTGSGYAIIAGMELKNFATEKLFKEYALNYDDVDKESNDTVIKSYFGTESTENTGSTTDSEVVDDSSSGSATWATFFYIFSSLLLGIVLILALVATIIKKHPIKVVKQEQNEHEKDLISTLPETTSKKKSRKKKKSDDDKSEETQVEIEDVVKKDDGFV